MLIEEQPNSSFIVNFPCDNKECFINYIQYCLCIISKPFDYFIYYHKVEQLNDSYLILFPLFLLDGCYKVFQIISEKYQSILIIIQNFNSKLNHSLKKQFPYYYFDCFIL
jgi:hypothetical protein